MLIPTARGELLGSVALKNAMSLKLKLFPVLAVLTRPA
jgi:hypothetical protein